MVEQQLVSNACELYSCFSPIHTSKPTNINVSYKDQHERSTTTNMIYYDVDIHATMNLALFHSKGYCDYRTITNVIPAKLRTAKDMQYISTALSQVRYLLQAS